MTGRRDFRTPPSLPLDTQKRCITIPASQAWLGLVNAALLMLTEAWRYDQVETTDMTPEETAEIAYQMYVQYLGECAVACCPMRVNPFNGRLQQSHDGGLTWFDVADGPWTESLYPPFSAMPAPRPEPTTAEQKCAAAATAAYVLRNLYEQTGNTLLNVVAATDWEYAGALGAMLQGFLMMIGAVATQPYVAIATLLGIVGVRQQYVDYPLDDDDEERLTCILLENATVQPDSAVTFDFQAVWDAIDLDSPKNGLMRFLLTMIGPDALNYAGAIDAGLTPDCDGCNETWCMEFDFTTGQHGWSLISSDPGGGGNYVAGVGFKQQFVSGEGSIVSIDIDMPETTLTGYSVTFAADLDSNGGFRGIQVNTPLSTIGTFGNSGTYAATGSWLADRVAVKVHTYLNNNNTTLSKVILYGQGENPFGVSNC